MQSAEFNGIRNEDDGCPPWEATFPSLDFSEYTGGTSQEVPPIVSPQPTEKKVLLRPTITAQSPGSPDLEVYRRAAGFKRLRLLSGNGWTPGQLDKYVAEHYGIDGQRRLKFARFIMQHLNYRPSPDVLLMLSCTNAARIVVATAGAGKTTSLQFDIVISKIIDKAMNTNKLKPLAIEGTSVCLPRVLYLNYNRHNVNPIRDKHQAVCAAVNKLFRESDAIDNYIDSSTVHSFCHKWLESFQNASEIEIPPLNVMNDSDKEKLWESLMVPRWKKFYGTADCAVEWQTLEELYVYKTESMLEWEEFFEAAKFVDTDLNPEFVKSCLKKYDSMKKQVKLLDFTDYLHLMIEVLKNRPDLRRRIQERYTLIIADENQDFTKLMNELLIQLYDPEVNKLVVVGDPDQTIYAFKGVSPDNVVSLSETLSDVQLIGLDTNYRCPDKIVDAAKMILDMNILRFDKPILTVRTGGGIYAHPVYSAEAQYSEVLNLLYRLGESAYSETVITYRNTISSVVIAEELYYAGIPFVMLDSNKPFNNPVFRQLTHCLRALKEKDNLELNRELYRFMPLKKEQWCNILEDNRKQRKIHLHDVEVNTATLPRGCVDALKVLIDISYRIDKDPVCDFIASLVRLYKQYHFQYITRIAGNTYVGMGQDVDNYGLYLDRAVKFYSRQMTFSYMQNELASRLSADRGGVTLSTFHGLKGLEFDYVLAIDFRDSIFPNFYKIEQNYSRNTAIEECESENRLCYVLVTRTKKQFHMFYPAGDPSAYVGILKQSEDRESATESARPELTLGPTGVGATSDSHKAFIQKLLGNRG